MSRAANHVPPLYTSGIIPLRRWPTPYTVIPATCHPFTYPMSTERRRWRGRDSISKDTRHLPARAPLRSAIREWALLNYTSIRDARTADLPNRALSLIALRRHAGSVLSKLRNSRCTVRSPLFPSPSSPHPAPYYIHDIISKDPYKKELTRSAHTCERMLAKW